MEAVGLQCQGSRVGLLWLLHAFGRIQSNAANSCEKPIVSLRSGRIACVQRSKFGVGFVCQASDAAADGRHDDDAQANDGCGQNDPVNSYCASFIVCEGFEYVQKCHFGFSFSGVALKLLTASVRLLGLWSVRFRFGMNPYSPAIMATLGSIRGIFLCDEIVTIFRETH